MKNKNSISVRFSVLPTFFRYLITSAIERQDGVEYRTLVEVFVNVQAGTFQFSPEVSEYIMFEYHEEGLEQCLRKKCAEDSARERLLEWKRACDELEWTGFGGDIAYDGPPRLACVE